ncbi:hypothetical protein, partial [Prosthecobacter sp.]|uniref:hypothetical protein n=1 Tax=Prosthecobacter sp. TaxID=1965333 RepID=UPI001DC6F4F3
FGGVTNPDGSYSYNGITYQVEWSDNLLGWSSAGIEVIRSEADASLPSGYRRVTVRGPHPLSTHPKQFMRVRVTAP